MDLRSIGVDYGAVCSLKGDWDQMNSWQTIINAPSIRAQAYSFAGFAALGGQLSPSVGNPLLEDINTMDAAITKILFDKTLLLRHCSNVP